MQNQKTKECPQCKEWTLWHNLRLSPKNNEPYENWKCSNRNCSYIVWETKDVAKKHYDEQLKPHQTQNLPPTVKENTSDPLLLILDEIKAILNKYLQGRIK